MLRISEVSFPSLLNIRVELYCNKKVLVKVELAPASSGFICHFHGEIGQELLNSLTTWLKSYAAQNPTPSCFPNEHLFSTPFCGDVSRKIAEVPYGKTASYSQIAQQAGSPKAARAVGNICKANPFPLLIPCHRIIAHNGDLGGFAYGTPLKQQLLAFERQS